MYRVTIKLAKKQKSEGGTKLNSSTRHKITALQGYTFGLNKKKLHRRKLQMSSLRICFLLFLPNKLSGMFMLFLFGTNTIQKNARNFWTHFPKCHFKFFSRFSRTLCLLPLQQTR
jgi:hypothetical protein